MEKDQLTRKLAVILHADVVGSTSLVQQNESLAHRRIRDAFGRLSKSIGGYGGKAREIRGDALVAEFERASDAVCAALEFQSMNTVANSEISDAVRPEIRIGISLGEVIVADNTITGAGVILAQRLEQLADAGGVVVQGSVSETVPGRLPFEFKSLGEHNLKGFDAPVRACSASLLPDEVLPAPERLLSEADETESDNRVSARLSAESYEALTGERLEVPEKASIAVLPFENMSGDSEQEHFADGITEDIITALSCVPELIVIARNSTFAYKGRATDVREVGESLGVGHVLEGSIRRSGERLRITAQLVNTQSGGHIWADRYDRKIDDIFNIQDDITRNIVTELQVKLSVGEVTRIMSTGTQNLKAWELLIRAGALCESMVQDDLSLARQLVRKALDLDGNYSSAWSMLGWTHWEESIFRWCSDPEESIRLAEDAAKKAIELDGLNPDAYTLLGHVHLVRGESEKAIEMCKQGVEIAPNNSYCVALLANALIDYGRIREGIQHIKRAFRLCPFPPAWYFSLLGTGYHLNGENEAAVYAIEKAVEREPHAYLPRLWLVSALVEMGKIDEARAISKTVLDIEPDFSAREWAKTYRSESHARLAGNLRAAGFEN